MGETMAFPEAEVKEKFREIKPMLDRIDFSRIRLPSVRSLRHSR
jgi:hypothetical protein